MLRSARYDASMLKTRTLALSIATLALSGCLAKAAVGVVTLPVRAVGAGVDAVTTTQREADEDRGRAIRKREEQLGKLDREYRRETKRCENGDERACERAAAVFEDMAELRPTIPVDPDR